MTAEKNDEKFETMLSRSANRATLKVFLNAKQHQQALPIWENGHVKHIIPTQEQINELERRVKEFGG